MSVPNVLGAIRRELGLLLARLEAHLQHDFISISGPIAPGLEHRVRFAVEPLKNRASKLTILLTTPGGVVEVVERMVNVIRYHYQEVTFVVRDVAMFAGTVFVMSGDHILMDYFSCLGPIDPQLQREGRLIPVLAYLKQFERLKAQSMVGALTTAEMVLLNKLDLAELHQYEQARELSVTLLKKWLTSYKFKNWSETATRRLPVTPEMKVERAQQIALALSETERWHSHSRGIGMETLVNDLGLQVEDFRKDSVFSDLLDEYNSFVSDLQLRESISSFVHSREYL